MLVSDFDFDLPQELIAQRPLEDRASARMLVMERDGAGRLDSVFHHFAEYFREGDCLVLNDTRVIPARLWGERPETHGRVQVFMLESRGGRKWQAFLKPGRRLRIGARVVLDGAGTGLTVLEKEADGACIVEFDEEDVLSILEKYGKTPLPPYISREAEETDKADYQTIYAKNPGSVACPTAGLHMTPEIMAQLEKNGVRIARLTLHVGAGTFKPVESETIEGHVMHEERYTLSEEAAEIINSTHRNGGRVFCMGTTSVRTVETCADGDTGFVKAGSGRTSIFLYPPKRPKVTDGLLTNFHLPQSTLLMLVCCFAPYDNVMAAYRFAIHEKFRFFSYGDCMLLLPPGQRL
ncbi:MAG: tRNA preQ1(34) S-adenosylmethionine ribosyltransferase-isomerase QueA [Lentisphaeria bacterium]|nr:tRNA preQ1(34) S-adenosylmethionine ribosyltransferase-isomerase QueA [Lentisphaeria bacterium]